MSTAMTGIAAAAEPAGTGPAESHAALADLDIVLVTAPDRLARNYVHQVLLIEELAGHGCRVEFLDRPMSDDPHDQLLLQIRGAVAEYERTLITERMRRGRGSLGTRWTFSTRLAPPMLPCPTRQITHQSHTNPACRASHPPAGNQTTPGSRRPSKVRNFRCIRPGR